MFHRFFVSTKIFSVTVSPNRLEDRFMIRQSYPDPEFELKKVLFSETRMKQQPCSVAVLKLKIRISWDGLRCMRSTGHRGDHR